MHTTLRAALLSLTLAACGGTALAPPPATALPAATSRATTTLDHADSAGQHLSRGPFSRTGSSEFEIRQRQVMSNADTPEPRTVAFRVSGQLEWTIEADGYFRIVAIPTRFGTNFGDVPGPNALAGVSFTGHFGSAMSSDLTMLVPDGPTSMLDGDMRAALTYLIRDAVIVQMSDHPVAVGDSWSIVDTSPQNIEGTHGEQHTTLLRVDDDGWTIRSSEGVVIEALPADVAELASAGEAERTARPCQLLMDVRSHRAATLHRLYDGGRFVRIETEIAATLTASPIDDAPAGTIAHTTTTTTTTNGSCN